MAWVKAALSELVGLFVDDGSLALAVIIWLGVAWLLFLHYSLAPGWAPVILFVGLALILIESVLRGARKGARP